MTLAIDYFNTRAEALFAQYTGIDRRKVHADLLPLLPQTGGLNVLDIGAGSGIDAALFASLGHNVVATEPAEQLRSLAMKTFTDKNIIWNSDVLPELVATTHLGRSFDIIYAIGVIQYLDQEMRFKALEKMFSLAASGGLVSLQYPVPPSREYQFLLEEGEITGFIKSLNGRAKLLVDKSIPDYCGRKTAKGEPIVFRSFILRRATT
jgi:cyclopropane fatty-acyl-phospholipid synthase-like methyltransferase